MLRNIPLRKKLTIISSISSGIALIATILALIIYDSNTHRPRVVRNLEGLADLYNATLPATISFNDPKAAIENLSSMSIQHEIKLACIYKPDGRIFAKYIPPENQETECPLNFSKNSEYFLNGNNLKMFRKIIHSNEILGHLFIQYEMPPTLVRLMQYGTIILAVLLSLLFTSILFITGLENRVIRPILKLETVAKEISINKDYKLRASKLGEDEIGSLTDEFNQMLNSLDGTLTALSKSESRFRRVSESNMIGIIFVNIHGVILEANDYFLDMIGYTREDLINNQINWAQLTPPEYNHLNQKAIAELMDHDVYVPFEKEYYRKDGSRVAVLLGGAFLQGSKTEVVDFVLDITNRKRIEFENIKLLKEEHIARTIAEEALQIREDFMSIAAHELRTPLTPLSLQLGFIKNEILKTTDYSKNKLLLKYLHSSNEQVNRLSRLIEDMLDVAHIRTGRLSLNLENIDVTELIKSIADRFELELKRMNIELVITIKTHLLASWDRIRIEQVLTNLLTNAMKYGERKPIHITLDLKGENALLSVQDFGIGIAEADQKRIFNRFERAVSVKNYGGLGLGLYITRQIVEAHHGHVTVISQPGKGTTFIIELPLSWPLKVPS